MPLNESERKLVTRFCQVEGIKSATLKMMQMILRFQDYVEHKKEEPDWQTLLSWVLNFLFTDINQVASITQSKYLVEANNLVAEVITDITAAQPNFQQIINKLREAVTKITSEAATVAKELKF